MFSVCLCKFFGFTLMDPVSWHICGIETFSPFRMESCFPFCAEKKMQEESTTKDERLVGLNNCTVMHKRMHSKRSFFGTALPHIFATSEP